MENERCFLRSGASISKELHDIVRANELLRGWEVDSRAFIESTYSMLREGAFHVVEISELDFLRQRPCAELGWITQMSATLSTSTEMAQLGRRER